MVKMKKALSRFKYIICIVLSFVIGLSLKEKASYIRPIGTLFINLIFVVIVPFIFLIIAINVAKIKKQGSFKNIMLTFLKTTFITLIITGIFTVICFLLSPGYDTNIVFTTESVTYQKVSVLTKITEMLSVNDFSLLLTKSNVLALIVFSIIIGVSINKLNNSEEIIKNLEKIYSVIAQYFTIVLKFIPIGIICYLSSLIGEYGKIFLKEYIQIGCLYFIIGFLNILVFHTLYLCIAGRKKYLKLYYKNFPKIFITALTTQSSIATMPINMSVLEDMKIDERVNKICTPISTLINMQGNVIEGILKIFLIISIFNLNYHSPINYLEFIIVSMLCGMVTAGIPGGGVVSNTLIVEFLGLPLEALPIMVTIEWILDSLATAYNILSDTATLPLVNKLVGEKNDKIDKRKKIC